MPQNTFTLSLSLKGLYISISAKRIVMASHTDSVMNGGNYDGILGVMSAMEVLETVVEQNMLI